MKKKPERMWILSDGFEIRKLKEGWAVFEGGKQISREMYLGLAEDHAKQLRKSRNEQIQSS